MSTEPYTFLVDIDRPELVTAVRHALTAAGIPYQTGLQSQDAVRVSFFVPWRRLEQSTAIVSAYLDPTAEDDEDTGDAPHDGPTSFPWGPVQSVLVTNLFHLALVFWSGSSLNTGPGLGRSAGLIGGGTLAQPWRLITSLFVHADPRHVFWNGLSMLVFAVPLIGGLGYARTGLLYLTSGVGGGICALAFAGAGDTIIGSSGAVAGLFGAWCVWSLFRGRRRNSGWRGWVRSLGIALLVLPSLLTPVTTGGAPISVSSHLGGLLTGMLVGALLCGNWLARPGHSVVASS